MRTTLTNAGWKERDQVPHATQTALRLGRSGIREIVNLVIESEADVARLEIGEPGFSTPSHIVDAAVAAARSRTGYTQSAGVFALRERIALSLSERYRTDVTSDAITVTQGAGQGIAAVFDAVLQPGDEVLIPDPAWPNYEMLTTLRGAVPVHYPLVPERGFLPDLGEIEGLITDRTRVILFNSPNNPTGSVAPRSLVKAIVELAAAHDILVVSDEVYDELIFAGQPANAREFGPETVVSVFSFSKTYAMTGWRVGYVVAPSWLSSLLGHIQEPLLSCISSVSQAAALAALEGPQECVGEMRSAYRARRDRAFEQLGSAGIDVALPQGAFYLMVPLAAGVDSRTAALELVGAGVSTAPGTAFGQVARSFLRISLAPEPDVLECGITRLVGWLEQTEGGVRMDEASARTAS